MAYCTAADVKLYLGISSASDDALIGALIDRAKGAIDSHCNRTFETPLAGDETRFFDAVRDTDKDVLWLDEDLAAVTSIDNGGDALTVNDWTPIPRNTTPYNRIRITCSEAWQYTTTCPEDAIAIVGKWCYSTTPPDDIKHAAIRLASFYYRQKDSQVFDSTSLVGAGVVSIPAGMPPDVLMIIDRYIDHGRGIS